jgi:type 1 fimbria pilin
MKTLFSAAATSLMLLTCATAHAASTVDLTVRGLIVPSACTPNLSGGGVIDHGKISAKDLRPDNPTHIGKNVMTIAVVCDGATSFALNAIDNRADSAIMGTLFGLGFINGTQKLGWFGLMLQNAVADGVQVETIASGDGGNTWYKEKFWDPGLYMSVATTDDTTQPVPVKELVMEMEVSTSIARTDSLDLSNEVTLDGSATLEVKYL